MHFAHIVKPKIAKKPKKTKKKQHIDIDSTKHFLKTQQQTQHTLHNPTTKSYKHKKHI